MANLAIHPGEHLQDELQELRLSAADLAQSLSVSEHLITEVLRGERDLSADLALRLGHYFGMSPEFWMGLQNLYDLRVAEQVHGEAIKVLPTLHHHAAA